MSVRKSSSRSQRRKYSRKPESNSRTGHERGIFSSAREREKERIQSQTDYIEIQEKESAIKNSGKLIYQLPDADDEVYADGERIKILYHPRRGMELVDVFMPFPPSKEGGTFWLIFCPIDDIEVEEEVDEEEE